MTNKRRGDQPVVLQCPPMGKTSTDATTPIPEGIYCRQCDYDLRGQETLRCPECGRAYDPADRKTFRRHPRRRWSRGVILAAIVLLILPATPFVWLYYDWHREQEAVASLRELRHLDLRGPGFDDACAQRLGQMRSLTPFRADVAGDFGLWAFVIDSSFWFRDSATTCRIPHPCPNLL